MYSTPDILTRTHSPVFSFLCMPKERDLSESLLSYNYETTALHLTSHVLEKYIYIYSSDPPQLLSIFQ
ncbi:hypothetical protein GLOIN_2v1540332 [Rhizophagus irregularis DAOM 181602=DAOM 197198]|nr:hypothetical protein GLOIN_2v1540332 [Rhizophagus irregularis DAOM 181602=DAOM 197198]